MHIPFVYFMIPRPTIDFAILTHRRVPFHVPPQMSENVCPCRCAPIYGMGNLAVHIIPWTAHVLPQIPPQRAEYISQFLVGNVPMTRPSDKTADFVFVIRVRIVPHHPAP